MNSRFFFLDFVVIRGILEFFEREKNFWILLFFSVVKFII